MCPVHSQITGDDWKAALSQSGPEADLALLPLNYNRAKQDYSLTFEEYRGELGWEASAFLEENGLYLWLSVDIENDRDQLVLARTRSSDLRPESLQFLMNTFDLQVEDFRWVNPEVGT